MNHVKNLTQSYVHLEDTIQKLSNIIKFQKRTLLTGNVPNKYKPLNLKIANPNNRKLQDSFYLKYKTLFKEHLKDVIKENETSLELKRIKLLSIISTTKKYLITCQESQEVSRSYNHFITHTNLTNHTPCPENQHTISTKKKFHNYPSKNKKTKTRRKQ